LKFSITHNLVDVHNREIFPATIHVEDGIIVGIEKADSAEQFIIPGFIDSHIHVESSMLLPSQFARVAVTHGTVATVSDPHEIANVCGVEGVELMLRNAAQTNFKFCFGAPACVPATVFETAGASINVEQVTTLLNDSRIGYLSEMMDFPGVLNRSRDVMAKIAAAKLAGKPVDGHAPGLRGEEAKRYVSAGISTDHECFTYDEAIDKIAFGCKIAIREGSAARNFDALESLIDEHPAFVMLCSDDKHPDEFLLGHINRLCARAIKSGRDLMNVLRVACLNPIEHYQLDVGQLRIGDPADFAIVEDLTEFQVAKTFINGECVAENGKCLMPVVPTEKLNNFSAKRITADQLQVPAKGSQIRVIQAMDGQLITNQLIENCKSVDGLVVADVENDLLKIAVVNRYNDAQPSVAFVKGIRIQSGAFASSVAHDSHNIVAVGTNDDDLADAINAVIDSKGGLSVSRDSQTDVLPLPVAGLMSTETCEVVAENYSRLDQRVKNELGSTLRAPYMTLSFMALLVIPSLKLSDLGLFDGVRFEFVSLFVDN
jgi:adenine deaminase